MLQGEKNFKIEYLKNQKSALGEIKTTFYIFWEISIGEMQKKRRHKLYSLFLTKKIPRTWLFLYLCNAIEKFGRSNFVYKSFQKSDRDYTYVFPVFFIFNLVFSIVYNLVTNDAIAWLISWCPGYLQACRVQWNYFHIWYIPRC